MKKRRMKVDRRHLWFLSTESSGSVQKEGTLQVGRQEKALKVRFCRLRGNLLFILKEQCGELEEVLLLERCNVMKLQNDDKQLTVCFEGGDPPVLLRGVSGAEASSWLAALTDANVETLRRRVHLLHEVIGSQRAPPHTAAPGGGPEDDEDEEGDRPAAGGSPLHLTMEFAGLVATATRVRVHVSTSYMNTEEVLDEGVFVLTIRFPGDGLLDPNNKIKVTVYHHHTEESPTTRSFLGFTSFSIRDLLGSKQPHVSLTLRTMDGGSEVGEVKVSCLQMEGENEGGTPPEHECPALCDSLHSSVHDRENGPMMRAALCAQVSKVYRFQTEDQRWLLVREQMAETPLSFSLPKLLLGALIGEHAHRVHEVTELGELSPRWDGLRRDVTDHCNQLIDRYQETLGQLEQVSVSSSCFKSSCSKSERQLQFVPTNLHSQRMEVTSPAHTGVWYEVITFGAPADHHQAFKHGGLKRLLTKHVNVRDSSISYSRDETSRARDLLTAVARLQPLVFGLAEELLAVAVETDAARLREVLDALTQQTEQFVHALKDELVRSVLMEVHSLSHSGHAHSTAQGATQDQGGRHEAEYNEEEWDTTWANVAKSLNCIVIMADRLQGRELRPQEVTSAAPQDAVGDASSQHRGSPSCSSACSSSCSSWQEQLLPLVVTLRECVREAMMKAQAAMSFVVLQGAVSATLAQGPTHVVTRRHAVFSQALSAVVFGFMLKLYGGLEDPEFLQQLHQVGVLVQFEGLLSTYGDELGMLEDMEVGVADLSGVTVTIREAKTEEPDDLLPRLRGSWGSFVVEVLLPPETFSLLPPELRDGRLIRVEPVLFNIGINQQQSLAERFGDSSLQERLNQHSSQCLRSYCHLLAERRPNTAGIQSLEDLLSSLDRSVESKKRKNVEVLWIAASVCRAVNGVRLTSCKSAKDRTAMSVTLEQCVLLRERHLLSRQHFSTALDCMRRDGCRLLNVQKNIGSRKFAFSGVQLLTFPKLYRPPDGSYG